MQGLTRSNPAAPDSRAEPASILLDLLSSGDNPLITTAEPITAPADSIVVVGPRVAPVDPSATPRPSVSKDVTGSWVALMRAAQDRSEGAVLADGSRLDGDLTSVILADRGLAGSLTTVTGTDVLSGRVSVPLALNARIGGINGHYGFGGGETRMPVRLTLPPSAGTPRVTEKTG